MSRVTDFETHPVGESLDAFQGWSGAFESASALEVTSDWRSASSSVPLVCPVLTPGPTDDDLRGLRPLLPPWEEAALPAGRMVDRHVRQRFEQDRREAAYLRLAAGRGWLFWGDRFQSRWVAWLERLYPDVPVDHLHLFSTSRVSVGSCGGQRPSGHLVMLVEPYWQGPGVTVADIEARARSRCAALLKAGWTIEVTAGPETIHWPGWTVLLLLLSPRGRPGGWSNPSLAQGHV